MYGLLAENTCDEQLANTLKRLYSTITLVGYAAIVGLTWPFALVYVRLLPLSWTKCYLLILFSTGTLALTNGGPAGAVWVFLAVACGMFTVVVSMAEMASMLVF
jgi:hypothetical protein